MLHLVVAERAFQVVGGDAAPPRDASELSLARRAAADNENLGGADLGPPVVAQEVGHPQEAQQLAELAGPARHGEGWQEAVFQALSHSLPQVVKLGGGEGRQRPTASS